ncbi:murein transglycosylase A [Oscillatoria sp. FACHB-1407]|uniref:murein transglycosylase A n=1 Tax=Oscillatoria sp. FACHB-1407 TaxID=2692847 RepID=UPI0016868A7B|nr:murein transglycosylase A [Oscillatoria sp. FACHB-1407]MBD2464033.1 murein transglycosylase A [Oscillatoria sp. FACHB-1407]
MGKLLRLTVGFCLGMVALIAPAQAQSTPQFLPLQLRDRTQLPVESYPTLVGLDDQLWEPQHRQALLTAIAHSLDYLQTPAAEAAYRQYPVSGFTRDRVRRSLLRFRELVQTTRSPVALQTVVMREFELYQSVGHDGLGTVDFTGYFEPTYVASRVPTAEFRYPLYREPANLTQWTQPHPTRTQLEGRDGLQGSRGLLRGLELVWLRDRLEAFLIQVQGSARLQLADGTVMTVGYAGRTEYPYTGIGRELIRDGKLPQEGLTLPRVIAYFQQNPDALNEYLPRNNRFVFFRETGGAPPLGSLSVPVTAERSIATDKTLMPPGALALIHTQLPYATETDIEQRFVSRFVLDQDTGGAIRGAGRVDVFMGTGTLAGDRAGLVNTTGQLYYLLLRE